MIQKGDCLSSVALQNGYFPGTLWEHPENDALRELRGDPNVLFAGDRLFLPDKEPRADHHLPHRQAAPLRAAGLPARFRLQILNADKPRPNLAYRLTIDGGLVLTGSTSAEGVLDVPIPPDARRGTLYIEEDDATHELCFGGLDPAAEGSGVKQRLANLGYLRGRDPSEDDLAAAVAMFQRKAGLDPTGRAPTSPPRTSS